MATARILTGIVQLCIAAAAIAMALGLIPSDAYMLAALVGLHNAVVGGERIATNGKNGLSGD